MFKRETVDAYKIKFGSDDPVTKEVMKDLEYFCGYNSQIFIPGQTDHTAFLLGARSVFLRILSMLNADEKQILNPEERQKNGKPE